MSDFSDFDPLSNGDKSPVKPKASPPKSKDDPFSALMAQGAKLQSASKGFDQALDAASFVAPGSAEAEKAQKEKAAAEAKAHNEALNAAKLAEVKKAAEAKASIETEEAAYNKKLNSDGHGYAGKPWGEAFTCLKCGSMGTSSKDGMVPPVPVCSVTSGAHEWRAG